MNFIRLTFLSYESLRTPLANMIKLIILGLGIIAICQAWKNKHDCTDDIVVNNVKQVEEVLKKDVRYPYQLAMDYDTDTLFFSYHTTDGPENSFTAAFINVKTNESGDIEGLNGFAQAVDGDRHIVYLGGRDGIFTYDFNTKTARFKTAPHKSIWQMFYKDKLYFSTYPLEKAYVYENGQVNEINELKNIRARVLAVDLSDNLYYANSTGFFQLSKTRDTHNFKGEYNVNGFAADKEGNLYFSTPKSIYSIDGKANIKKVVKLNTDVFGLAIDEDHNIIYASDNSIIRLKSTGIICNVTKADDDENGY